MSEAVGYGYRTIASSIRFDSPNCCKLAGGCSEHHSDFAFLFDQQGFPAPTRKAVTAAGLAALTLDCVPANLPAATGASGARLLGIVTPGSSANWARCLAWMAAQAAPLALSAA